MTRRAVVAALLSALLALVVVACDEARPAPPSPAALTEPPPVLILVSLDGFGQDYLGRTPTPNLDLLIRDGARAEALVPVFPTKTFPSHHSMVTGLWPEHHGIVGNRFHDPAMDADFVYDDPQVARDPRWWGGEPIWVTAARRGLRSATMFWPGSDVEIAGARPTYWRPFDHGVPPAERVDQVLAWLDLPSEERPSLITLYLSDVDGAGHAHGPGSREVHRAIGRVDGTLGRLIAGLKERDTFDAVNLIVVSDHGMAPSSPERVIFVDDYIDLKDVRVVEWDPLAAIWPHPGREHDVQAALSNAHPHLTVYRRDETPERWHYRDNARIPPLLALADEGWRIASHGYFSRHPARFTGGMHGYDNAATSMRGILVAHGPAFRKRAVVGLLDGVDVYPLLAAVLHVDPAPNDGDVSHVRPLLADR